MTGLTAPRSVATGQDLRQGIDHRPGFLAAAPALLKREEIHPPVQQAPVIRQFGLDICGQVASRPELIEGNGVKIGDERRFPNLVDSSSFRLVVVAWH
jgi:hypothetical protein